MDQIAYELVEVGAPLRRVERPAPTPGPGQALVRVLGCGVCHTDLGFAVEGVRTRAPLPLVLGHEVVGVVERSALSEQVGQVVIVPAVIPCGGCADCQAGHPMICARQVMPGNDLDGGFARWLVVPAPGLCVVPEADPRAPDAPLGGVPGLTARHLAVIADAVSTPYQAVLRSGLQAGDVAVVVGLGGVGGYAVQIARALGATVVGLDVSAARLAAAGRLGCALALDPRAQDPRALKKQLRAFAQAQGLPTTRWVILECSGSAAGQALAFELLVHGATLMVVGFTLDRVELRLSNLMALDARALGNWGCAPEHYPAIVRRVLDGQIDLVGPTEIRPLQTLNDTFDGVRHHRLDRRVVLAPDWD